MRNRNGWLYLDFYCYGPDGRKIRAVESTGLKETKHNRKRMEDKDKAIRYELKHGRFDYLHFFPNGAKANRFKPQQSDITLNEWWDRFNAERSVRPQTFYTQDKYYDFHIRKSFGYFRLVDIDESAILVFRKELQGKSLKNSTINTLTSYIKACLRKAEIRGLIHQHPFSNIKPLEEEKRDIEPFSFDELNYLLDFLKEHKPEWYDLILFWSNTGLRPGEIGALRWENVDFLGKKLAIRRTRHQNRTEGPPKTKYSNRDIDLLPGAIEALKRQEAQTKLLGDYVFLNQQQAPWVHPTLNANFLRYLLWAGIRQRSIGQLRHTFATLTLASGENISWISKMLGHANVEVTMARYNRYVPNLTRQDGSVFSKKLGFDVENSNKQVTNIHKILK